MTRNSRSRLGLVCAALALVLALLFCNTFRAAPLPAPPRFAGAMPPASPPSDMALVQLPTGVTHRSAGFAYRGGSFADTRDFVMTAALVKHPRGDLLIDTGFGRQVDAHFRAMPWTFRAITRYERGSPAADQLDAAGYDRRRLRGILLTHVHWDHVSGVPDFPEAPVLVPAEERRFVDEGGELTRVVRGLPNVRYVEYAFEAGPYLGFDRSHDVYSDGSVVVVPAPGHTPGSVIIFVATPDGRRHAFVGDLAWQREGITEREERPWLQRTLADVDPAEVRRNLLRMTALSLAFPELVLVPAHDARGFALLPRL